MFGIEIPHVSSPNCHLGLQYRGIKSDMSVAHTRERRSVLKLINMQVNTSIKIHILS